MAEAQAEADLVGSLRDVIEEHRDYLIERIEPDFGLLDKLRENKTLSRIEIAEVKVQKTLYKRNSAILDYIFAHNQCDNFMLALRDAHQMHIANFITANGQFKPEFGGDWPLTEQEISIIDANHTALVDLLDPFELVPHLFSAGVINNRQKDTISSKQTIHEKNETFLDILTRRSLFDYHKTISCLHASNQSHISQILDEGGIVVRVHANLQDDHTEDEIISRITELLNGRSQEDSSRILEVAQQRVIWVKKGQSIVIYIFIKTLSDLLDLKEMYLDGELKKHLCTLFTHIISRSQYVEVNVENLPTVVESVFDELFQRSNIKQLDVTLSDEEFERCFSYFPDKTFVRAINDMDSQQLSARERKELLRQISIETSDGFENCAQALSFRKGDIMLILSPTDLAFRTKWWKVRHLGNLQTGYIRSNRVVIDYKDMSEKIRFKAADDAKTLRVVDDFSETELSRGKKLKREDGIRFIPSATTVNDLPLELLNIVLRNSYLLCTRQKSLLYCYTSENAVNLLASVNDYWHQIIKRRRFKEAVWRFLAGFYKEISRNASISRNIRSYLVENMNLQAIRNKLMLADCLTDVQARLVNRQTIFVGDTDKKPNKLRYNSDAWHILRSTDKKRYSEFCRSLRQTDQKLVARVAENGGVVLKSEIQNRDARYRKIMAKQLVECINDLHGKTKPRSHETEKQLNLLMDQELEILNSVLDRQALIWFWCKSPNALKKLENLTQRNSLMSLFTSLTKVSTSTAAVLVKRCTIDLDNNQFEKKMDLFPTVSRFIVQFDLAKNRKVIGVAKLKNRICVVYGSACCKVLIFEDKTPFHRLIKVKLNEILRPEDIASCCKEDCLYIADSHGQHVWKISRDKSDDQFIAKIWLSLIDEPHTLSVNNDGQLLMVRQRRPLSSIAMYDSDCNLILDAQLHTDIQMPLHAVETSNGNFIILHEHLNTHRRRTKVVSEVTRDGQMIIRNFAEKFTNPRYLSLYDDGKVFVADEGFMSGKVILLQSGQVQSQMICPTGDSDDNINEPSRLCYDNETGQLIVGTENFVNVYTVDRY